MSDKKESLLSRTFSPYQIEKAFYCSFVTVLWFLAMFLLISLCKWIFAIEFSYADLTFFLAFFAWINSLGHDFDQLKRDEA